MSVLFHTFLIPNCYSYCVLSLAINNKRIKSMEVGETEIIHYWTSVRNTAPDSVPLRLPWILWARPDPVQTSDILTKRRRKWIVSMWWVLAARRNRSVFNTYHLLSSLEQPSDIYRAVIPISQRRKQRHREVQIRTQVPGWWRQDWSPFGWISLLLFTVLPALRITCSACMPKESSQAQI